MPSQRSHLNTLGSEDELGHHGRDVGLVKHGVSDALQQGLHGSHAVHEKTSAQAAVVEPQEDEPRAHLAHTGRMIQDQNIHGNTTEAYSILSRRIDVEGKDSCVLIPLPLLYNTNGDYLQFHCWCFHSNIAFKQLKGTMFSERNTLLNGRNCVLKC